MRQHYIAFGAVLAASFGLLRITGAADTPTVPIDREPEPYRTTLRKRMQALADTGEALQGTVFAFPVRTHWKKMLPGHHFYLVRYIDNPRVVPPHSRFLGKTGGRYQYSRYVLVIDPAGKSCSLRLSDSYEEDFLPLLQFVRVQICSAEDAQAVWDLYVDFKNLFLDYPSGTDPDIAQWRRMPVRRVSDTLWEVDQGLMTDMVGNGKVILIHSVRRIRLRRDGTVSSWEETTTNVSDLKI